MYSIDYKFSKHYDNIIDAFTQVYGEENRKRVEDRINNTIIFQYQDYNSMYQYYTGLDYTKRKHLKKRFIKEAHIEDDPQENEIDTLLGYVTFKKRLIDTPIITFEKGINTFTEEEIKKIDKPRDQIEKDILENKLKVINFYYKKEEITIENLSEFEKTEEYKNLVEKIRTYIKIFTPLLEEYNKFKDTLKPYEEYYEEEKEKSNKIKKEKEYKLLSYVLEKLPLPVLKILDGKSEEEKYKILISYKELYENSCMEYFHSKEIKKLKNPKASIDKKSHIMAAQAYYLKQLGVDNNDYFNKSFNVLFHNNTDLLEEYIKVFEENNYRQYAPSDIDINRICRYRQRKNHEYKKDFFDSRKDIIEIKKWMKKNFKFTNGPKIIFGEVQKHIKEELVCIDGVSISTNQNGGTLYPIMLYTARSNDEGFLQYSLLHEFGHAIDKTADTCGFDNDSINLNPYNNKYRKYEKLNEAINDMFTRMAFNYLKEKDIYLIEPKEFVQDLSFDNFNSFKIVIDLLQPLYDNFKDELIKTKLNDQFCLENTIGKENFEELNDVVNKVDDYLRTKGIFEALKNNETHELLDEYNNELNRASEIYKRIFAYRDSRKEATPIKTR